MRERIDPDSPVPLYWQVAEALRYRVATGELTPGDRLPSLREAAEAWSVNMHTVRRAYAELAELGIVDVRPRSGTVVLERPRGSAGAGEGADHAPSSRGDRGAQPYARGPNELAAWLRKVAAEGAERWRLDPRELGAALADLPPPAPAGGPVFVIECSESQSSDLARQLHDRWRVAVEPWSLERDGSPPAEAILVGTYFHYNDIRVRWPHRFPHVRFVATRPDAALLAHLEGLRNLGGLPLPVPLLLWERDEAMARNIAADLLRILPEEMFSIRHGTGPPDAVPDLAGPVLFSPRSWAEVPAELQSRKDFMEVRYVFEPGGLDGVARELGWERR